MFTQATSTKTTFNTHILKDTTLTPTKKYIKAKNKIKQTKSIRTSTKATMKATEGNATKQKRSRWRHGNQSNRFFFLSIPLQYYGKYPAQFLEPKSLINLYVPQPVTGTSASNFQVRIAIPFGRKDPPTQVFLPNWKANNCEVHGFQIISTLLNWRPIHNATVWHIRTTSSVLVVHQRICISSECGFVF